MVVRKCQNCNCEVGPRKKFCDECKKALKREYAKKHYQEQKEKGIIKKRYGLINCVKCGTEIVKNRPDACMCYDCYKKYHYKTVNDYNKITRTKDGRHTIGRKAVLDLGFDITNFVIHHIDENPENNKLINLMILDRSNHAKLHKFLEKNWSLLLKNNSSNLENCWNILRDQLTTVWLETTNTNVIKITDIGQSAAEPLNKDNIYIFAEEGSETMYQTPKSNTHGEDIVQTQNLEIDAHESELGK